jgi:hypothetical protein
MGLRALLPSPQELHQQQQVSEYFKGVLRRDSPSTIVHEMLVERGEVRSADSLTDCCSGTDLWGVRLSKWSLAEKVENS